MIQSAQRKFSDASPLEVQKNPQKPGPDRHRTKSAEPASSPASIFQAPHEPSTQCIIRCDCLPRAGISPALVVRAPQKARPGLNFGPGRAAGPELCISSLHHLRWGETYLRKCILRKTIGIHVLRLVLILCVAWCLDADGFVGGGNAARAVVSLIQGAVVDPCGDKGYS